MYNMVGLAEWQARASNPGDLLWRAASRVRHTCTAWSAQCHLASSGVGPLSVAQERQAYSTLSVRACQAQARTVSWDDMSIPQGLGWIEGKDKNKS